MPTSMQLDEHLTIIRSAADVLAEAAGRAGLAAPVPTCPEWDTRLLVIHQGMVHRWAAAHLRGDDGHSTEESVADAAESDDLLGWFGAGVDELLDVIAAAPDDAEAPVFLNDAPPPRRFLARRQAHETTVHSVDALSAALGRPPSSADVDITHETAMDGIDELLGGFITRPHAKLRSADPYTIAVVPDDDDQAWTVSVSEEPAVTSTGAPGDADAVLRGPAAVLYLGLWNRGDEITGSGRPDVLDRWREQVRVRWPGKELSGVRE